MIVYNSVDTQQTAMLDILLEPLVWTQNRIQM